MGESSAIDSIHATFFPGTHEVTRTSTRNSSGTSRRIMYVTCLQATAAAKYFLSNLSHPAQTPKG
jgi:hypothetical protein